MTNFEYWKDRILEIVKSGDGLALKNGNPTGCYHTICENCNFYNGKTHGCNVNRIAWLYSEHEEKPKLTKRERKLCEAVDMAIEALQEPEIVHCKDCKYWIRTRIGEEELNQCGLAGYLIGGRGYCLYGKAGEQE